MNRSNELKRIKKKLRLDPPTNMTSLVQSGQFDIVAKRLKRIKTGSKFAEKLRVYQENDIAQLDKPDAKFGRLPIHWACYRGSKLKKKALRALINASKESVKKVDKEGSTPLHCYLLSRDIGNNDCLKILLEEYPEAVMVRDNFGCTPIFHLIARDSIKKMSAVAILLNTNNCVDALTIPCGPLQSEEGNYQSPPISSNQELFPNIGERPANQRTPLYIAWRIALTHKSNRWWERKKKNGEKHVPKLDRKKTLMAINFLACAYLRKVDGSVTFSFTKRRSIGKVRRQMRKAVMYELDENVSDLDNQSAYNLTAGVSDGEELMVGQSDSEIESFRYAASSRWKIHDQSENNQSVRSLVSLETAKAMTNSRNYVVDESDEFSTPQSSAFRKTVVNPDLNFNDYDECSAPQSSIDFPASHFNTNHTKNGHHIVKNDFVTKNAIKPNNSYSPKTIEHPNLDFNSESEEVSMTWRQKRSIMKKKKIKDQGKKRRLQRRKLRRENRESNSKESVEWQNQNGRSFRSFDSIEDVHPQINETSSRSLKKLTPTKFRFTHAACMMHQWLPKEIIDVAKEYHPKQFDKREEITGDIPLHLAIRNGASKDLLVKLLDKNENTASTKTRNEQLPLHLLLECGVCDLDKIGCLLRAYPDGIDTIDPVSHLYPFALLDFYLKEDDPLQPYYSKRFDIPHQIPESRPLSEADQLIEMLQRERTNAVYSFLLEKPSVLKHYS